MKFVQYESPDNEGHMVNCEHCRPHIRPALAQVGGTARNNLAAIQEMHCVRGNSGTNLKLTVASFMS
jgi:hypothetical protein